MVLLCAVVSDGAIVPLNVPPLGQQQVLFDHTRRLWTEIGVLQLTP